MHVAIDFVDKVFSHLEELGAGHLEVTVANVSGCVRKAGCLKET